LRISAWRLKRLPGFMDPEGVVIFHAASGTLFKKTLHGDELRAPRTRASMKSEYQKAAARSRSPRLS